MKKIIIYVFLIMAFTTKAVYANSVTTLHKQYCPKPPYNIASDGKRSFQSKTGLNALAARVAEHEIKKEIKKNAKGKIKVRVKSYSLTDAKQGKFKSFEVTGKNIVASDVYVSQINVKTTCDFLHLDLDKSPVGLVEPVAMDFDVQIKEEDINKTLQTPAYQNYAIGIKRRMVKISFFEFSNTRVSLNNNQFDFKADVQTIMGKPFTVNVISKLAIHNNKVVLENLRFGSTNRKIDGKKMKYLLNIFDPMRYMQTVLNQYNCKTILKSVKIEDGKIIISGSAFLGKS